MMHYQCLDTNTQTKTNIDRLLLLTWLDGKAKLDKNSKHNQKMYSMYFTSNPSTNDIHLYKFLFYEKKFKQH